MSVLIPFEGGFIGVRSADEPDPRDVCPGECRYCHAAGVGCERDWRIMVEFADGCLVQAFFREREE